MPLTPAGINGSLILSLTTTGNIGTGVPQLASAVAAGIILWNSSVQAISVDVGVLGVGASTLPCLIPGPLALTSMLTGLSGVGMVGVMMPAFAAGLAQGITLSYIQGLITMVHPTVGVGSGVVRFMAPPAAPQMIAGFASLGLIGPGPTKTATGIGLGLDLIFAALTLPVPIVGSPSIIPSGGAGTGSIL